MNRSQLSLVIFLLNAVMMTAGVRAGDSSTELMHLRVPLGDAAPGILGPVAQAERRVINAFDKTHPNITITGTEGLQLPGGRTMDMVPFMQIAGGIAPDVLDVNFRSSATYIDMELLRPLDHEVEAMAGVTLQDGSSLANAEFFAAIRAGKNAAEISRRIPLPCEEVMRRRCPFGDKCPYRAAEGLTPLVKHRHVWCFPSGALVTGMMFDRGMLAEHADEGIEQRAPKNWEELLRWAQLLTHPDRDEYGLDLWTDTPAWRFLTLLYSAGGRVIEEQPDGRWQCTLNSDATVEAAYFYARLRLEKIERDGHSYRGVVAPVDAGPAKPPHYGLSFCYLDEHFLNGQFDRPIGFGPVPAGPAGERGSEFNSRMLGVFSGIGNDTQRCNAAWDFIRYIDGDEAQRLRIDTLVSNGLGRFVRPDQLRLFNDNGRYNDLLLKPNAELEETFRLAFASGVSEPYGPNCQYIYEQMNRPLGAILQSTLVRDAIDNHQPEIAKAEIRRIFAVATDAINAKTLHQLAPETIRRRNAVAWAVIAAVGILFAAIFWRIWKTYTSSTQMTSGQTLSGKREQWVWVLLFPALASVALWSYWPLIRGTFIAFQDYNVQGTSTWVGAGNFADVLFDRDFWYSMKLSLVYTALFMVFGFWVPIGLALLLSEVPTGKGLFRTIYYLPAVLSGLVVILLWKNFYSPEGLINAVLNCGVAAINAVAHSTITPFQLNWLDNQTTALFCCLLPIIWAGMGPGCLIYLAALKTVPEEIYEAADIDGAGTRTKIFRIALPSIKALVIINLVGAVIAAIRGASGFVLAMTGGGPYSQSGGATEVIGLKIFYTTFGALKFGTAAAMAWVLGAMLIGFTVIQLQSLSRMEFKTARKGS